MQNSLYLGSHIKLTTSFVVMEIIISILLMREQLREIKAVTQGHTASKR